MQYKTWRNRWCRRTYQCDGLALEGPVGSGRDNGLVGRRQPPGFRGIALPVPVLLEIGSMDLLRNTLRLWTMHREFRAVLAELNGHTGRERASCVVPSWQEGGAR